MLNDGIKITNIHYDNQQKYESSGQKYSNLNIIKYIELEKWN